MRCFPPSARSARTNREVPKRPGPRRGRFRFASRYGLAVRPVPLTRASVRDLPACCTDCVFWQTLRGDADWKRRAAWADRTERDFGPWGRVLADGDDVRGIMQYGPSGAFPRAKVLPAGPPSRDAALVTCAYVTGDDAAASMERLLLEALADIKGRGMAAIELFAMRYPDEVHPSERAHLNHTLFDMEMLDRLGFRPVRRKGQVSLMRLELGGLVPGLAERAKAVIGDLRPLPGRTPLPA